MCVTVGEAGNGDLPARVSPAPTGPQAVAGLLTCDTETAESEGGGALVGAAPSWAN